MFFNTNNANSYRKIYTTERPYTSDNNDSSQDKFLPTTLSDLTQIVTLFTDRNQFSYKPYDYDTAKLFGDFGFKEHVAIHHRTRELCENAGLIGNESRWDDVVDQQISKLKTISTGNSNLALTQLEPAVDLIKRAIYKEQEAYDNDQTLFWRFDKSGHEANLMRSDMLSFSDSLLSGYVKDGMYSSDISLGLNNYSACTFSYCDIHRQGIKAKENGYIMSGNEKLSVNDLGFHYKDYLNNLDKHELYVLKFDNELLQSLSPSEVNNDIYIPATTISSAACFLSGEKFHPSIDLSAIVSLVGNTSEFTIDVIDL